MKPVRANRLSAFTLVELLIVVSIISILALIALPNFSEAQTRAKVSAVKNNMRVEAQKFEMLNVDTNHYPMAGKWRWCLFWNVPTWVSQADDKYDKFDIFYKNMFGPHQDLFEWEALKRQGVQDYEWLAANDVTQYLANGFNFFHPKFMIKGIEQCGATWQDMDVDNWKALHEQAGEWMLYSPGPDLIINSPAWIDVPGWGYGETGDPGYVEKALFIDYDSTNGTVSYGNIIRTQKSTAGLGINKQFIE